jgi:hypothetical protein
MTYDISKYVKPVITVGDLLPILTELDKSLQMKAMQSYPSLIAMLKTVLKPEYINQCEEFDVELVTQIVNYANEKIPFKKIVQILNGENIEINNDIINQYCKDKVKVKDLKVILDQLDKQTQTNVTSLYMTITAILKTVLRDDVNVSPENLEINVAAEILAYAMQKINFNKIQQLFGFLT